MLLRPRFRYDLSIGLIPVSLVAVMTQPKFAAQFAAETAALGRITSVTLVASGFLALVASGFLALVASGFLALVASGFLALVASVLILRGCRGLDVRRGSDLRRFGPRRPRFRGRGRPSACRTRLLFHAYHASGYGRAVIAQVNHDRPRAHERAYGADLRLCGWLVRTVKRTTGGSPYRLSSMLGRTSVGGPPRWRWDLNPRRLAPHTLSRRAPSAARTRHRRPDYRPR
jgi:hypothetical protein